MLIEMVEKIKYNVLKKIDDIEIRQYPELILAVVEKTDDNNSFNILFDYISGNNYKKDKIKMTAPVISSTKIEMTTPVISRNNYMAFVLPSSYNKNNVPNPLNPKIKIEIQPKKQLAVLRFSGYTSEVTVEKMKEHLLNSLKKLNIKFKGTSFLMRYNSPFTPGFLRRNEIAVEISNNK